LASVPSGAGRLPAQATTSGLFCTVSER